MVISESGALKKRMSLGLFSVSALVDMIVIISIQSVNTVVMMRNCFGALSTSLSARKPGAGSFERPRWSRLFFLKRSPV